MSKLNTYHVRRRYDSTHQVIMASSPRDAACEWARCQDAWSNEYEIAREIAAPVVIVTTESGRACGEWVVTGETVPSYKARPAPK